MTMRMAQYLRLAGTTIVVAATVSACGGDSSEEHFHGGAGLNATVGDVRMLNLLIVAGEEGGPGVICGSADNTSDQQRQVDIRLASGSSTTMTVPAHGRAELHCEGDQPVVLDKVDAAPGALAQATLTSGGATSTSSVPVLYPNSVTPYGTLAPPGWTPSPTVGSGSPAS